MSDDMPEARDEHGGTELYPLGVLGDLRHATWVEFNPGRCRVAHPMVLERIV